MSRYEHFKQFGGKSVVLFEQGMALEPATKNYRIAWSWENEVPFAEQFADFLSSDGVDQVTGLVVGAYCEEMYDEDMSGVIEALASAASQLSGLTDLFVGDITSEENEISWIHNTDISPLWTAYPRLRTLVTRGGNGLSLGTLVHDQLRSLIIETGGLGRDVIAQIVSARLPELEHLEIWTGNPEYGADSSVEDVRPFFESSRFPKLKYLGIKNCDFGDELAALAVSLPILLQVEILDFSMGAMSDAGAEILLKNSSHFASLKKLDLGENMLTAKTTNLFAEFPCEVSTDGQREGWVDQQGNVHRYPAVGE